MNKSEKYALYYILNLPTKKDPLVLAEEVISGGVDVIQLRAKNIGAGELYAIAAKLKVMLHAKGKLLIINDRLDVAMAVGADGVHLGKDDLPLEQARHLAPDLLIGISCYRDFPLAEAAVKGGADYVAFGAFYPSPTKPNAPRASLDVLSQAQALPCPVVAIGGIQQENIEELFDAGANGVAIISAIQEASKPAIAAKKFKQEIEKKMSAQT